MGVRIYTLLLALAPLFGPMAHAGGPLHIDPTEYFEALDYIGGQARASRTMSFECRMRGIEATVRESAASPDPRVRAGAGLSYAYAAMFMTNVFYAVRDGVVDYETLVACGRYATEMGLEHELLAREREIARLLERAAAALPGDMRVRGWRAGARIRLETLELGQPTRAALEELVASAEADLTFNLFGSLIVARDFEFPADLSERLHRAATTMTSKRSPCRIDPDRCKLVGTKAPHASRAALILLADTLLQHAERSEDPGDEAAQALFMYLTLRMSPEHRDGVEKWRPRAYVLPRIERARALVHGDRRQPGDFWRSWPGVSVARCASCHSGR